MINPEDDEYFLTDDDEPLDSDELEKFGFELDDDEYDLDNWNNWENEEDDDMSCFGEDDRDK